MTKLIRWSTNPALLGVRDDVDRLFESVFQNRVPNADGPAALTPPVDIEETKDAFIVRTDLPGVAQKDVKVSLLGDVLTIRGERRQAEESQQQNLHRVERRYGTFERSFSLGAGVRADQVKANYRDGVLEIHVPKAEEARVREIEVQVAS
jgi:HSP20 family protein